MKRGDASDAQTPTHTLRKIRAPLLRWYDANRRDLPWRRTSDPFAIWISEAMLQQTRVETVIPYWERFLDAFPDVESLAKADLDEVYTVWTGLGYYSRARNLKAAAETMVAPITTPSSALLAAHTGGMVLLSRPL